MRSRCRCGFAGGDARIVRVSETVAVAVTVICCVVGAWLAIAALLNRPVIRLTASAPHASRVIHLLAALALLGLPVLLYHQRLPRPMTFLWMIATVAAIVCGGVSDWRERKRTARAGSKGDIPPP